MAYRYNGESCELRMGAYVVIWECMLKKAVREDTISTLIQRIKSVRVVYQAVQINSPIYARVPMSLTLMN